MPQKLPVIANASPLIALSAVLTDFNVLDRVAARVLIPAEVLEEIRVGRARDNTEHLVQAAACCEVLEPFATLPAMLTDALDRGEAAVIHAAMTFGVNLVAIDELRGRRWAQRLGLELTGSLGLVVQLHREGVVPSLETAFAAMKAKGIRLQDRLLQEMLLIAAQSQGT